jgi:predicted nucleotidyltransferase
MSTIIDPLNIFDLIKNKILDKIDCEEIWATGSRVSNKSRENKWDFDLVIVYKEKPSNYKNLSTILKKDFVDIKDENKKNIRIDLWFVQENKKTNFLEKLNLGKNVKLY